jgi:hypothetical protein
MAITTREVYFSASLDNLSKIVTALVAPIFTLLPLLVLFALRTQKDKTYLGGFIVMYIIFLGIFLFLYFYWIQGYTVKDNKLIIHKKMGTVTYNIDEFKKVQVVSKEEMGWVVRLFGNGGLFGYNGYFTSKTFGKMKWYSTKRFPMILIEKNNGFKITITPDDMAGFILLMNKVMR